VHDPVAAAATPSFPLTASSSMPLTSLAAVELQLVMQCLDRPSLLALARCNRALLAAASHPFAWQCMPAVLSLRCAGGEPLPPSLPVRFFRAAANWVAAAGRRAPTGSAERLEPSAQAAPIPSPLTMARRYNSSLLRFHGCKVWWSLKSSGAELRAQLAEVAAMPRITELGIVSSSAGKAVRLPPKDVALLVDGLVRHSAATLTLLHLDDIRLGDEGAVAAAQLVRDAPRLRTLLLDNSVIGAAGWHPLGEAVGRSRNLAELSLNNVSAAGNAGALAIAAALKVSTSLQRVSLSRCWIGDAGAVALAGALRSLLPSSRLEILDLSYNVIEDDGATALVDAALGRWVPRGRDSCCDSRRTLFFQSLLRNSCISAAVRTRLLDFVSN